MKSRHAIGYVVEIDGINIRLNLMDVHRGHLAAHGHGISTVTEVGSLLGIASGGRLLVMKVQSLSFAEPKEVHRHGFIATSVMSEPLRHLCGVVVGQLKREGEGANKKLVFIADSLSTPSLGAEVFPLIDDELSAILGNSHPSNASIYLGDDLRGGGRLMVDLESLIARHVAVLGSSGQGKSCFTAAVLQQIVKMPRARVVIFDINGEYEDAFRTESKSSEALSTESTIPEAFPAESLSPDAIKITRLGAGDNAGDNEYYQIPYYALGRTGLRRLLLPSDKTQGPALTFALKHLNKVQWFDAMGGGVGLANAKEPTLFDDCRSEDSNNAQTTIQALRKNTGLAQKWPPMQALGPLIADSYALVFKKPNVYERSAFNYGHVAPLITRIARFVEDSSFRKIVNVEGGEGCSAESLNLEMESKNLIERLFGAKEDTWRVHIVDLRCVSQDLMPFVLGSILELYANELFNRGQENKVETLLVLEEAHHYLRQLGTGEEAVNNSLAYERLAKEGRKFGLALWLSTQRPSDISPTVLSQCNTWVTFRLSSEKDLSAIQYANEWADKTEVRRIAGLARQHALAFGGGLQMATLIKAANAVPTPRSKDGRFNLWAD